MTPYLEYLLNARHFVKHFQESIGFGRFVNEDAQDREVRRLASNTISIWQG
jgi:hypothetical protein